MRFLLINPFCPISEGPTPPLGLSFLAAVLERATATVKILDYTVFPYSKDTLRLELEAFKPDIVGCTSVTMTFLESIKIIKDVKCLNPDILTVMGGPHVTFCAEETLNDYSELDLIVLGEGEETVVELVEEFCGSKNWSNVKGLAFRNGTTIVKNESRPLLDVNTLPAPARHLLPLGRYRALHTPISMTTSRGCPFKCIFCIGRKMVGSKVRYRNPKDVVDELEYLASLDFPQINISDDLFTSNKRHCFTICDKIIERNLNIKWSSFARVDTVNLEVLQKMKEAGCQTVSFGVETANTQLLKLIKKGITIPKVKRAIKMCTDAGITPHVSFIIGLPSESPETLMETQNFGQEIADMGACYGFHLLAPFPGTAVCDENEKYDLSILTKDWSKYHANKAIVETKTVTADMLNSIANDWERITHETLADIRERMKSGDVSDDEAWQVNNLDRFLLLYNLMMDRSIEENATWRNGEIVYDDREAIAQLATRLKDDAIGEESLVEDVLTYAFERGSLRFERKDDQVRWKWQNYI